MISIKTSNLYKRFQKPWIIEDFSYEFKGGSRTGIAGRNGSGKSTLLRILAGFVSASNGEVNYFDDSDKLIKEDRWYKYFSFFGPNIQVDEEFRPAEIFDFVSKAKEMIPNSAEEFLEMAQLQKHKKKEIGSFSSGMKQRLALSLMLFSKSPVLFLDEPGSYLDKHAKEWMQKVLTAHCANKTVIIASNEPDDFRFCESRIQL